MLRLECDVKHYGWGKPRSSSLVAELASQGQHHTAGEQAYAELWMGAHPSGPSKAVQSKEPLNRWLENHPHALGKEVLAKHGQSLPFLFKVLSIEKCLSIQSHPDRSLAKRLHAQNPLMYKDPNHKPELALAVQDFEALCGFCSVQEISMQLERKPELRQCVGSAEANALMESLHLNSVAQTIALKRAFTALMTCDEPLYRSASEALFKQLQSYDSAALGDKDQLFIRIFKQFPGDVGTLAVFFLNHIKLNPGEAVYLAANEPHAYISGELIEAMANSDNVIRAGLTPKFRDTQVLCESLTYKQGLPHMLQGQRVTDSILKYQPPFEEFQVLSILVNKAGVVTIPKQKSPMLLMTLQSEGSHRLVSYGSPVKDECLDDMVTLSKGSVLFVPAHTSLKLHSLAVESDACSLLAYAATANDNMFAGKVDKICSPMVQSEA